MKEEHNVEFLHTLFPPQPFPFGQYPWSMMMGLSTSLIMISLNIIPVALLGVVPDGHDLILIPLSVLVSVLFFTVIPKTSSSFS